jgi:hypothetical protein
MLKEGSRVLIPRTGGGYSPGTVVAILDDRAMVEFKIGKTLRGQQSPDPNLIGAKVVFVSQLKPFKGE